MKRDVRASMLPALIGAAGDAPAGINWQTVIPESGFRGGFPPDTALPSWLTPADVDFYTGEFERTGFRGGLNWYRTIELSWELMAAWTGAQVTPPAIYIAGDKDVVVQFHGMLD